jgi:HAD superfamily hydrolase (TIGR01490 family)
MSAREDVMVEKENIAAVFDFDGTLSTGHLFNGVIRHHIKHQVKRLSVLAYLITHLPLWLLSKMKIQSEEGIRVRWGEDLAILFKGFEKQEGLRVFEWVVDNYFSQLIRLDILGMLRKHRREGHIVVLLSGTFTDFLEIVRQKLFADYAIGTKLELINNIYSGKIIKPLCFGINKAKLLNEFINQEHLNIDLDHSFAYADSIFDVPVLEMVGNPVAAYPDEKLLNLAQRRGWRILSHTIS